MDDSISAKLGNVLESENDVNTSDEAINRLKEEMKLFQKTGSRGLISEKKEKLNEMKRKLENSKFDEQVLEELLAKSQKINEEIKEKQSIRENKQKMLTKKIENDRIKAKIETYNNLSKALEKSEQEYNTLNSFFKNGKPTENELEEISQKYENIKKIEIEINNNTLFEAENTKLTQLENKFFGKEINEQEIDEKISSITKLQEIEAEIQKTEISVNTLKYKIQSEKEQIKKTKTQFILFIIIGIIISITGLILTKYAISTIGIILIIISLVIKVSKKTPIGNIQKELTEITENLNILQKSKIEINSNITVFIAKFEANLNLEYQEKIIFLSNIKTEYIQYKELLNQKNTKQKNIELSKIKKAQLENEIQMFMTKYFIDINKPFLQMLQEIKSNLTRLSIVNEEYEQNLKNKQKFDTQNNMSETENANLSYGSSTYSETTLELDEEKLKLEINELSNSIDELLDAKNQLKNKIETLENKIDETEYLQNDIENLTESLKTDENKYKILGKTKELLEKAKGQFSSNYLKDMIDGLKKYLKLLNNKELETNVDINLNVQIDVNGSKREIKNFSKGYQDLMYICIRLGLINALFKNEQPFLVLDDPFTNLDDNKTEKALKLLEGLALDYQIIYFVCNSSRV